MRGLSTDQNTTPHIKRWENQRDTQLSVVVRWWRKDSVVEDGAEVEDRLVGAPPPQIVRRLVSEYVDCKKGTILLKLTTC
jgi:hypothetical protein